MVGRAKITTPIHNHTLEKQVLHTEHKHCPMPMSTPVPHLPQVWSIPALSACYTCWVDLSIKYTLLHALHADCDHSHRLIENLAGTHPIWHKGRNCM